MLKTVETQVAYVPIESVVSQDGDNVRLFDKKKLENLRASLLKSGQTHPLLLEKSEDDRYRILDGHQRFEAISQVINDGGVWEKVMGTILAHSNISSVERFRYIWEKNAFGENSYGLYERACFFKRFSREGLSIKVMSDESGFTTHMVEDHIELSAIKSALADQINSSSMDPTLALMLHHRYEAWLQTAYADHAPRIVERVLHHAKNEKHTIKSWRFLLDFYWNKNRPFLSTRRPKS
jgi:hypothetical protein